MSAIKIEAGKFYRTRCEKKVFIYADNTKHPIYPIHGTLVDTGDVVTWGVSGKCASFENPCDIVSEWVEKPIAKFWPEFKWQAMDKTTGNWYVFELKPIWNKGGYWEQNCGAYRSLEAGETPDFIGKPEDSLIEMDAK